MSAAVVIEIIRVNIKLMFFSVLGGYVGEKVSFYWSCEGGSKIIIARKTCLSKVNRMSRSKRF